MARIPGAEAGGGSAGTGEGGAGAGAAGAGTEKPGAQGGTGGVGADGGKGNEGGAGKQVVQGVDRSLLPPELQSKSDAELKFILNNMTSTIKTQAQRLKDLERAGSQGGKGKEESKPEPKEEAKAPLEDRILTDPEGVVAEIVEKRYGGVIGGLDKRTARSELMAARAEIEDFSEYEGEVLEMLEEMQMPATYENLAGGYVQLVGQKTIEEKRKSRQKAVGMENGGGRNPDEEEKQTPKLTDLEKEMAAAHHMTEEEWVEARDPDYTSRIRVPTGKREKQNG